MARLVGVDLPREKRVEVALTYIFGVGRTRSKEALAERAQPAGIIGDVDAGENDFLRAAVDLACDCISDRFERE